MTERDFHVACSYSTAMSLLSKASQVLDGVDGRIAAEAMDLMHECAAEKQKIRERCLEDRDVSVRKIDE